MLHPIRSPAVKAGWWAGEKGGSSRPSRHTNTTGMGRFGELLPLVSTSWATRQAATDAQAPRHRNVDQPAEDRLATLLSA